ncbi:MAG: hypothetical protein P8Y09_00725 [Deltaproteobacteria bacterium]
MSGFLRSLHEPGLGGDFDKECPEWDYECRNNQILISYLQKLSKENIGDILDDVCRADGRVVLRGYIYLGKAENIGKGVHLYIFKFKNQHRAMAWVDEDGFELLFPTCPDEISGETAYTLGEEVYTERTLKPGDGIVEIMCVKPSWLQKLE